VKEKLYFQAVLSCIILTEDGSLEEMESSFYSKKLAWKTWERRQKEKTGFLPVA